MYIILTHDKKQFSVSLDILYVISAELKTKF